MKCPTCGHDKARDLKIANAVKNYACDLVFMRRMDWSGAAYEVLMKASVEIDNIDLSKIIEAVDRAPN